MIVYVPESKKIKKKIQKSFTQNSWQITTSCSLKIVNYLDVTINLNDGSYKPYPKLNYETLYIHANSNHPLISPISVEEGLRELSSSKQIFEEAAVYYQEVLDKCGYQYQMNCEKEVIQ